MPGKRVGGGGGSFVSCNGRPPVVVCAVLVNATTGRLCFHTFALSPTVCTLTAGFLARPFLATRYKTGPPFPAPCDGCEGVGWSGFSVRDVVKIPASLKPGKYILGFRCVLD